MFDKPWASVGIWVFIGLFFYALLSGLMAEGPLMVDQDVTSAGLEIKRSSDGHYYLKGRIDDHPVTFLIDTGASSVAISAQLADEIGLTRCRPVQSRTANGSVTGCLVTAAVLSFGDYRVERPEINVLPELHGPALLGMNILERFRIEQQNGVMRLSPPDKTN
ncbi:MAG: retroviral-like aspartic protease family protein [Hydrogenophilales bacterium]|nr:retroviral-like aspartic protease family protein [Hydrogenophilales bacterium]